MPTIEGLTCSMVWVELGGARSGSRHERASARDRERRPQANRRMAKSSLGGAGAGLIGSHFTCLPLNLAPGLCRESACMVFT